MAQIDFNDYWILTPTQFQALQSLTHNEEDCVLANFISGFQQQTIDGETWYVQIYNFEFMDTVVSDEDFELIDGIEIRSANLSVHTWAPV